LISKQNHHMQIAERFTAAEPNTRKGDPPGHLRGGVPSSDQKGN
jgi:hypothetical protein